MSACWDSTVPVKERKISYYNKEAFFKDIFISWYLKPSFLRATRYSSRALGSA